MDTKPPQNAILVSDPNSPTNSLIRVQLANTDSLFENHLSVRLHEAPFNSKSIEASRGLQNVLHFELEFSAPLLFSLDEEDIRLYAPAIVPRGTALHETNFHYS